MNFVCHWLLFDKDFDKDRIKVETSWNEIFVTSMWYVTPIVHESMGDVKLTWAVVKEHVACLLPSRGGHKLAIQRSKVGLRCQYSWIEWFWNLNYYSSMNHECSAMSEVKRRRISPGTQLVTNHCICYKNSTSYAKWSSYELFSFIAPKLHWAKKLWAQNINYT